MNTFRSIADRLARDIINGTLKPGVRLPPQREFAYREGIAASTASRVYAELTRRGLTTGEVGRGTFVRTALAQSGSALVEPALLPLDLEMNFPILPGQPAELANAIGNALRLDTMAHALRPIGAAATLQARTVAATFLAADGWSPDPANVLFAGNGKQAIAAALAALALPGDRIGVEAITYPAIKGIAARLGIALVPLACDEDGLLPDALTRANMASPLKGIYVQPCLHNPMGMTMSPMRRRELVSTLIQTGLVAIEDHIYGFLADEPTLASALPEQVIFIDSLSKRIAPGLPLGLLVSPPSLIEKLAQAVRAGAWSAAGLPLTIGTQWMSDGTAQRIALAKRDDATARQRLLRKILGAFDIRGDHRAYHVWWQLPDAWRADTFVAAAARKGIAVTPARAFTVTSGYAPNAVRLALSSPTLEALGDGLAVLGQLASNAEPLWD